MADSIGGSGGAVSVVSEGTATVPGSGSETVNTGLTDASRRLAVVASFADTSNLWDANFSLVGQDVTDGSIPAGGAAYRYWLDWDNTNGEWLLQFTNDGGNQVDIDYAIIEV